MRADSEAAAPSSRTGRQFMLPLASASFFAFAVAVVWRPFSTVPPIQNGATLTLLVIGCASLAAAACQVRRAHEWMTFAVYAVLVGFIVRSLPVLTLAFPPGHDSYYYFATLLNTVEGKTLEPVYGQWYSGIGPLLNWPLLQLLTAEVNAWSQTALRDLWLFLPAALGSLTFVAVSLLARVVSRTWRIVAIAGLLGSFADVVLFYQSQFHPQGVAILLFPFVIFLALQPGRKRRTGVRVLAVLAGAAFLFTHHASSLLLPFLLMPVLAVPYFIEVWKRRARSSARGLRSPTQSRTRRPDTGSLGGIQAFVLLLIVVGISMQLYLADDVLRLILSSLDRATPPTTAIAPAEWWMTALRFGKYALAFLAIVGILVELRFALSRTIVLVVVTGVLAIATVGSIVAGGPGSDRLLGFWAAFASVFAAAALARLLEWRRLGKVLGPAITVSVTAGYLAISILNSHPPAFTLQDTPRSAGTFYGNALPRVDRVALAGVWLRDHTAPNATYAVDFTTIPAPFFFARRSLTQLVYDPKSEDAYCGTDYFVSDYRLSDERYLPGSIASEQARHSRIYDNGSVAIGEWRPLGTCAGNVAPHTASPQTAAPSAQPLTGSPPTPWAIAQTVLGLVLSLLLMWTLGYVAILIFARDVLRPRQIEVATALMLGICVSGLLLVGPARFLAQEFWFEKTIAWTTPVALVLAVICLVALNVSGPRAPLRRKPTNVGIRTAARLSASSIVLFCLIAAIGVLIASRPILGATTELYGRRTGTQVSIVVVSSSAPPEECVLLLTDDEGQSETPRFTVPANGRVARALDVHGHAEVELNCFGDTGRSMVGWLAFRADSGGVESP